MLNLMSFRSVSFSDGKRPGNKIKHSPLSTGVTLKHRHSAKCPVWLLIVKCQRTGGPRNVQAIYYSERSLRGADMNLIYLSAFEQKKMFTKLITTGGYRVLV